MINPLFPSLISPTSGFSFSYTEFHFYVDEPTTIQYDEMKFSINNQESFNINVTCYPEDELGLNMTSELTWYNITIPAKSVITNSYSIVVGEAFGLTAPVKITCRTVDNQDIPGSGTASGGTILNWVTFYSEDSGALLDLKIVDQANRPRNASNLLRFRANNTTTWSPILEFEGSRWIGYMPTGLYQIVSTDLESSIVGEKVFSLTNDTVIKVELFLVGFQRFKYITIADIIGINATINNFMGEINGLSIYGELYKDGKLFSLTPVTQLSRLEKVIGFEVVLWFNQFDWEDGNYELVAYIDSFEITIATKSLLFSYEEKSQVEEFVDKNPFTIGLIILFSSIVIAIIIRRLRIKYKWFEKITCNNCSNRYSISNEYCGKCGVNR